jgi:hypothetical protein
MDSPSSASPQKPPGPRTGAGAASTNAHFLPRRSEAAYVAAMASFVRRGLFVFTRSKRSTSAMEILGLDVVM